MEKVINDYINEFKKHYRYSKTNLGKIERIENYIKNLDEENRILKTHLDFIEEQNKYINKLENRINNSLETLKIEDGSICDYEIIEEAIDLLEGEIDYD